MKNSLNKTSLGIACMFGVYWIYNLFIKDYLLVTSEIKTFIGFIILYGLGLYIFKQIAGNENFKMIKKNISMKHFIFCFILQFTCLMIFSVIMNVSMIISGNEMDAGITLSLYTIVMLLVVNPIIEEYVFRKLFADHLLKYGEYFYIVSSSFCFSIVHGVSLGIPQIVYTFLLGCIWSYVYVKTGNLKFSVILHSLSNFFGSIIILALQSISEMLLGIYSITIMLTGMIGLFLFIKNRKKIILDNTQSLIRKNELKEIFLNRGIIVYSIITLIFIIIK